MFKHNTQDKDLLMQILSLGLRPKNYICFKNDILNER